MVEGTLSTLMHIVYVRLLTHVYITWIHILGFFRPSVAYHQDFPYFFWRLFSKEMHKDTFLNVYIFLDRDIMHIRLDPVQAYLN